MCCFKIGFSQKCVKCNIPDYTRMQNVLHYKSIGGLGQLLGQKLKGLQDLIRQCLKMFDVTEAMHNSFIMHCFLNKLLLCKLMLDKRQTLFHESKLVESIYHAQCKQHVYSCTLYRCSSSSCSLYQSELPAPNSKIQSGTILQTGT